MRCNYGQWVERRGQLLRLRAGLSSPFDVLDPYVLAERMQVDIRYPQDVSGLSPEMLEHISSPDCGWSGGALPLPDGRIVVVLNPAHALTRTRATLMEELAHIHLRHKPSELFRDHTQGVILRTYKSSCEKQAYGVGAAALLPLEMLKEARRKSMAIECLAQYCGVSPALVKFRSNVTGTQLG